MPTQRQRPSARDGWSAGQRVGAALSLIALGAWIAGARAAFPLQAGIALMALSALVVAAKVVAVLAGLLRRHALMVDDAALAALGDDLPTYSVLVPLYREAAVLPRLVAALDALDYPRDRLQAMLLLEEDDAATIASARAAALPPWMEAVIVSAGTPRTKPRACNHGLSRARGEFVVVFDAEDRPEPDQLRKAVATFRAAGPSVACLQAKLNCYDRGRNLVTRLFALEYSAWFDLYLPGLHALDAPIPLGGTSNHFRADALRALGGWDAWNVTEDCDLGMQLARAGLATRVIESTTWEEAPSRWTVWLKQRSRWMKGYWQTHLAHTRAPLALLRELGAWRTLLMLLTVGGQVASLLALPACWASLAVSAASRWQLFDPYRPWTVALIVAAVGLALANLLFIAIHAIAALRRRFADLAPVALLLPAYWLAVSFATWRGVLQSFRQPFLWEKTPHGADAVGEPVVARVAQAAPASAPSTTARVVTTATRGRRRWPEAIALVAIVAAIVAVALRAPRWLHTAEQIRLASIDLAGEGAVKGQRRIEASWLGRARVVYTVAVPPIGEAAAAVAAERGAKPPPAETPILRALAYLTVWDGEWYQLESRDIRPSERGLDIAFPLDGAWTSADCDRPWCRDCLRRVRAAGLRLYGADVTERKLRIVDVRVEGDAERAPLAIALDAPPTAGEQRAMLEIPFALSRAYDNPFDTRQIAVDGVFTAADGGEQRVPAFYTQDYDRSLVDGRETLRARGAPRWALRWTPPTSGDYRFRIEAREGGGDAATTAPRAIAVRASTRKGFARVDGEWFRWDDGSFLYPLGCNIRSPRDDIDARLGRIPQPDERRGSYVIEDFIDRLAAAHWTFGRVWMSPWFGGLEWNAKVPGYHGLGQYDLQNAWRLDAVLAHAAQKGLLIEFALNHHGPFTEAYDSQWRDNPYNARNGGPLRRPADVMTDPEARRLMAQRLRYACARWGADPTLFAWVMWIEADAVNTDLQQVLAWHQEMVPLMHQLDQGGHIVSTEFCNTPGNDAVWRMPSVQYAQMGGYSFGKGLVRAFEAEATSLRYGKPLIIEEYGGHAQGGSVPWVAHELHDGPWAAWMMPLAGGPMPWWWNLLFAWQLERREMRFAAFIAGEDLRGVDWRYERRRVDGSPLVSLIRAGPDRAYAWVYANQVSDFGSDTNGYWDQAAAGARTYAARAGKFDALAKTPGDLFAPVSGASLALDDLGLRDGHWRVEVWDTWSDDAPTTQTVDVVGGKAAVPLPRLTRDCALKLIRDDAR